MSENAAPPSNEAPVASPEAVNTEATSEKPAARDLSPAGQNALRVIMEREQAVRNYEAQVKQQAAEIERMRAEMSNTPDSGTEEESEFAKLRSELESLKEREATYRRQTVVQEEKARLKEFISSSEEYAAVKAAEAYDTVFEAQLQRYNTTGTWPSEAEVAAEVQDGLKALYEKLKPVFEEQPAAPGVPDTFQTPAEAYTTLNSKMTGESTASTTPPRSPQDINAMAAQLLRFKTT